MNFTISPNRHLLTITVDEEERKELRELPEEGEGNIHMDTTMVDFFERLTCNSELAWVPEGTTGDLTDAPMLGIFGEERPYNHEDERTPHRITGPNLIQELEERWAWMRYEVKSLLEVLRDQGEAVLVDSN